MSYTEDELKIFVASSDEDDAGVADPIDDKEDDFDDLIEDDDIDPKEDDFEGPEDEEENTDTFTDDFL